MNDKLRLRSWVNFKKQMLSLTQRIKLAGNHGEQTKTLTPGRTLRWQSLVSFISGLLIVIALGWHNPPASAQRISQAKIVEILGGNQAYIQNKPAQVNAVATLGQTVSTKQARVNLLFNNNAGVRLGQNSALTVGSRCVRLRSGRSVVSGAQGCVGSITAVTRGTVYLMELDENEQAQVKVLQGEVALSERYNLWNPQPILLRQGQGINISPEGVLGTVIDLSKAEIEKIFTGALFEGFNIEIPGIDKLEEVLNEQFPQIEIPDVLRDNLPSIPNPF
ncbi:MAG: hypothetical protein RIG63_20675 [Coleofasciculus chthonoplastes F3-SA18-01]|uniref:hypothetical protein n=1 Tax=Coleofasciculus chthonoplastes TaxID=64178 RepID=UPI0032F4BC4C